MFTFLKRLLTKKQENSQDPDAIREEFWQTDFHKASSARFNTESGDSYHTQITHEGFKLFLDKKNVYAWTVNPLFRYRDFVLESLIEFPVDKDEAVSGRAGKIAGGFLFRYLSESTFYSILVSNGGMVRMDAVVNGTPMPVLGWTSPAFQKPEDPYSDEEEESAPYQKNSGIFSLRVIALRTSFTIILNDVWVAECSDDTIQSAGSIAFAGQNWNLLNSAVLTLDALAIDSRPVEVETLYTRWNQYMKIPADAHISLARTWYSMGRYVPAIVELKHAWKERKPGSEELLLAGQLYLAQQLIPEAEIEVRKALALDNSHEKAASELAGILYLQNRFIELDELLHTIPRPALEASPFLSNLEGHLFHWKGEHEKAAESYHKAALLAPEQGLFLLHEGKEWELAGITGQAVNAWIDAARVFLSRNEYEDLDDLIPNLEQYAPNDVRVQSIAAKYYYGKEDLAKAESYLSKAVTAGSGDSAVWYLHGMILSSQGKIEDALDSLHKAAEIETSYGPYHFRLAETLFFAGKPCDKELERALETGKDNGWVFNLAALKALADGYPDQAESFIREARSLLPEELTILVNFAEVRRLQGKLDEVLPLLDTDDPESLRAGANLLVEEGRNEEADEWYVRAQRKNPFDPELLTDRAANCIELELLNEADDLIGRALDIKTTPRLYKLVSYLAGRKGEFTRSEVALQQGLSEFPNDPDLLHELSGVYIATKRMKKAKETAKRLRDAGFTDKADELDTEILEVSTNRITCSICKRDWFVPKDITIQGSLHLTAEPPDELPAGTCPSCGKIYCISCAKETLGDDGRFRCKSCSVPLKLIDNNIVWLLNQWQSTQNVT